MPGTGNVLIDAIAGVGWLDVGLDNHLTYFFDNSLGFHNWTESEKTALRGAFQAYANVADITFEEVTRGTIVELAAAFAARTVKGEIVVLVDRARGTGAGEAEIEAALREALTCQSVKDAAASVAELTGAPKREVYQLALKLAADN